RELVQLRFQTVGVAPAHRLPPPHLGDESRDLRQRLRSPLLGPLRPGGQLADLRQPPHNLLEARVPIERLAPPRAVEVAMLGQISPRAAEQFARGRVASADLAAK